MDIYVRALTAYPGILAMFAVVIALNFLAYFISERLLFSNISFVSNLLEPSGWKISLPLSVSRCYEHNVSRKPTKWPIVIMTINLLCTAISLAITIWHVPYEDLLCYTFINGLILLVSLLLWYSKFRETLEDVKHREYLKLIELCHCPKHPSVTVLLLLDRWGQVYTYHTTGTFRWKTNHCYEAFCIGNYIVEMDIDHTYKPDALSYAPPNALKAHTKWFSYGTPMLCLILSLATAVVTQLLSSAVFLACSLTFGLLTILTLPYSKSQEMCCCALRRSIMYKDLSNECTYQFIFLDSSGNPYYYSTDDEKALSLNSTYVVTVKGRKVLSVFSECVIQPAPEYEHTKDITAVSGFLFLGLLGAIVTEFVGLPIIGVVAIIPLSIALVTLIRYSKKGEL